MNAVWHSLKEHLIQQSGHIALLVMIVMGLCWMLRNRSAHVRYLLWLVVLAKCLVPPVMTLPLAILPSDPVVVTEPIAALSEPVSIPSIPVNETPIVSVLQPSFWETLQRHWLVAFWMGGVVVFGVGMMLRAGCFHRRLLTQRIPIPASLVQELADLQEKFDDHRSITAWLTPQTSQPFVWGWWRGKIYLPQNFMEQTNVTQRQSILAHELAHVHRCDPLVNLFQIVVQTLFWFHPLVWWANLQIRREREKCCDEMAISVLNADVKDYCNTIVDVLVQQCPKRLPLGSVAIAGPVRNIEERIKTMMNPNKSFCKKAGYLSVLFITLFALMATSVSLGITKQDVKVSFETDTNQRIDLILSEQLLQDVSTALCEYSERYDEQLPKSLDRMNGNYYDSWHLQLPYGNRLSAVEQVENITYPYLTPQWTLKPDYPIAFDNRLLQAYGGTYVLMSDGSIPYLTLEQMSKWELDQIEVSQEPTDSDETDRIKAVVSKIQSGDRLNQLGKIMLRYVNDQDKPLTKLWHLQGWGDDEVVEWALNNVLLLGEVTEQGVVAYDLTLLSQGQGTNVLYLDGQIEYANRDRLGALEVIEPRAQIITTLDLIRVPIENDVVSQFIADLGLQSEMSPIPRRELLKMIKETPDCRILMSPKALENIGMATSMETGSPGDDDGLVAFEFLSYCSDWDRRDIFTSIKATLAYQIDEKRITRRKYTFDVVTRSNESYLYDLRQRDDKQLYLLITVELHLPDDLK